MVIVDRASPHCAKPVKALLMENKEIRIIYLPKGLPYLNAVEECWHRAKQASCLKTLQESRICGAAYLNISTARHSLNIKKYLARKFKHVMTNF